jgi:hypothetical protein
MSVKTETRRLKGAALLWGRAARVASLKLRFQNERKIVANLEEAGMTPLEAFKAGAEEAQGEIVRRLALVSDKEWEKTNVAELRLR